MYDSLTKSMAGYSQTPLIKKLGIKEGFRISFVNAPTDFGNELGSLPESVTVLARPASGMDFVLLFTKSQLMLRKDFARLAKMLLPNGMLWVAWPKKSSGIMTDLSDNSVREIGLSEGLVDVKVCAVTEVWSGLKFVYRIRDRAKMR